MVSSARHTRGPPDAPWSKPARAAPRLAPYLRNGSETTTFTPEITPVVALSTCSTAVVLMSPAAVRAPFAAADAAAAVSTPTSFAPWIAPYAPDAIDLAGRRAAPSG